VRLDYKWQAAIVVAIGLFMGVLDNTIVSVALPQMQAFFHTDRDTITWVGTAYFLAQAAVIPIAGYLSDRIGTKRIYIAALAIFTLGSVLCAFAPNEQFLIAFRVFQGIGGGTLFPIAFAIIFRIFPPAERGPAGAVIGVPVLLAPAFGPTIGGYFTTTFDWRAIFLINLPVGIVAMILCALVLRGGAAERTANGVATGEAPRDRGRFDGVGLALSMLGFTSLVYAISEAAQTSWSDRTVQIALVAGALLLVAFVINELLVSDPVMDVRLFLNYTFTVSNLMLWVVSGFLFASLFLLPIFFQNVQGATPLQSGEYVIVQGLGAAVATVISGRLYNRVGPRWLVALGFALITAGTFGLTRLQPDTPWQSLQGWLVLRGLGLGFTNIPLQTLALSVVSNRAMARASSLVNVTRQVFGALGITVLTTIFVQQTKDQVTAATPQVTAATNQAVAAYTAGSPLDPTTPLGHLVATCAQPFGAAAQQHAPEIQACVQQATTHYAQSFAHQYVLQHVVPAATTHGLNGAFIVSMIGCAVAVVLALFVGRDPAVEAAKRAAARGKQPTAEPRAALVGD